MIWNSWGEFFAMGGYALYVWGSIVVVAGFMLSELFSLAQRRKSIIAQLKTTRRSLEQRKGSAHETTA